MTDLAWDPAQYNRYATEREQPYWDLCALLQPADSPAVVDLGCGDGRLTSRLHERLQASRTVGVDSSRSMLAEAARRATGAISFVEGDISQWSGEEVDVIFSNAALQWVPNHEALLGRFRACLAPNGQLALQVPANADHASQRVAGELADDWFGPDAPPDPVRRNVLAPEQYARVLNGLGFARQHVRLQVYPHLLPSASDVVEWMKGTSLNRFKPMLAPSDFERFVGEYRERLLQVLDDASPFFYPFKRILVWGRVEE